MPQTVEIPVVWLQGAACSGCAVSVLNAFSPTAGPLLLKELTPGKHVSVRVLATIMAGQGEQVIEVLKDTAIRDKGGYLFVMEGSIQLGDPMFATFGEEGGRETPIHDMAADLATDAAAVIGLGTCASFGGIPAGEGNLTGATSIGALLAERGIDVPVINVPGCPPHPDWLVGTLVAVSLYGLEAIVPTLDELSRPAMFFGKCVHETCPRRADFDAGRFARNFGEPGCMYHLGCKGPVTYADCPTRMWNTGTNWCVGAGSPCHGCVEPDFPDRLSPLYEKIDEQRLGRFRLLEPQTQADADA